MKEAFKPLIVILVVGVALGVFLALPPLFRSTEKVAWRTDYESARREAQSANKPLLLDFTAEWCEPCQQMRRTVFADRDVQIAIMRSFVPVQVDIDRSPALAQQYRIDAVPTYKIVTDAGMVLKEQTGAMTSEAFLEWLNAPAGAAST